MPAAQGPSGVAVLIPAAGQGLRLGGKPKQFRLLGGKPLLVQTLLRFEQHPDVDYLFVAAPAEEVEGLRHTLGAAGITKLTQVVAGGASRQASVAAALRAVPAEAGVVLVHDAVRPFLDPTLIGDVVAAVRAAGAAALAIPVTDTVRHAGEGVFGETVPRSGLYRMQTPQGFRRDWFDAAHAEAARIGLEATDDVDLVQRLGYRVHLVPGSVRNVKITTLEDWEAALRLWAPWEASLAGASG